MSTTTKVVGADDFKTSRERVRVWDPLVRIFHWSLVAGFTTAFLVEDGLLQVHVWSGYLALTLIALRLVWGLIGPHYARFSNFVRGPNQVRGYLAAVMRGQAPRYLGHNPAGGAMVVALMLAVTATGISGLALFGAQELSGPLAPLMSDLPPAWGHDLEDLHEVLANLTLALILVHLTGVLVSSLVHRENLVRAMVTGTKPRDAR